MDQIDAAKAIRFYPIGHPIFDNTYPLYEYFKKHFNNLGGMTPNISKMIGWENF